MQDESEGRELAMAKRCQILTGSFKDSTLSCPCTSFYTCQLVQSYLDKWRSHPEVQKAAKRKEEEFTRLRMGENHAG